MHNLVQYLISNGVPINRLAGHFHDTYGQAVANVWEAYTCGIRVFDSSVGGLGGCPFAPGAKGNVASEDLVYMFHNANISTGVDLVKLIETGEWISQQVSRPNSSRAGTALAIKSKSTNLASRSSLDAGSNKDFFRYTSLSAHPDRRALRPLQRKNATSPSRSSRTRHGLDKVEARCLDRRPKPCKFKYSYRRRDNHRKWAALLSRLEAQSVDQPHDTR